MWNWGIHLVPKQRSKQKQKRATQREKVVSLKKSCEMWYLRWSEIKKKEHRQLTANHKHTAFDWLSHPLGIYFQWNSFWDCVFFCLWSFWPTRIVSRIGQTLVTQISKSVHSIFRLKIPPQRSAIVSGIPFSALETRIAPRPTILSSRQQSMRVMGSNVMLLSVEACLWRPALFFLFSLFFSLSFYFNFSFPTPPLAREKIKITYYSLNTSTFAINISFSWIPRVCSDWENTQKPTFDPF